MRFDHLNDWLSWQESLNPAEIELGLDRVARVLSQAKLAKTFDCPLITVAGTNGKGSVVAILESIAMSVGLKVCSYTSPHIFHYNERIKCNAQAIDDAALCAAFERIDQARGEESLTYFEFGTLAAIDWIGKQTPDLVIMEVGLGGRLDAVNILNPDVSILTSVAIDHVAWLGDNRELIGYEKAGVFRANKTVICGEYEPPKSVIKHAQKLHCEFIQIGKDYRVINSKVIKNGWALQSCFSDIELLPVPSLRGEFQKSNAATAIVALQSLQAKNLLRSTTSQVDKKTLSGSLAHALQCITLPGRFQKIHSLPSIYVDVAHNPHAAQSLASQLKSTRLENSQAGSEGRTWAIVAMLSDKDVAGVLDNVCDEIDNWCFAGLENNARGLPVCDFLPALPGRLRSQQVKLLSDELSSEFGSNKLQLDELLLDESFLVILQHDLTGNQCTILSDTIMLAKNVSKACELVLAKANESDRVIIFGSFYTVADAMMFFSELSIDTERLD